MWSWAVLCRRRQKKLSGKHIRWRYIARVENDEPRMELEAAMRRRLA